MSEAKEFTTGEILQVVGRAIEAAGVHFEDDNKLTPDEIMDLVKQVISDIIEQWND